MDSNTGFEDWALACSWLPVGDQWEHSSDRFFEPLDLPGNKSDVAEYPLFNDDVILPNHSSYSSPSSDSNAWDNWELAVEPKSTIAASFLVGSPEHGSCSADVVNAVEGQSSPWQELPSTPESLCLISNSEIGQKSDAEVIPWQLPDFYNSLGDIGCGLTLPPDNVGDGMDTYDAAAVPECDQAIEDMLWDLDESMNDVIIDPVKLADIGLFLPPVSADDVDSLLSSSVSPSSVSPVVAQSTVSLAELDTKPLPVAEISLSQCQEEIEVASPATSDTVQHLPIMKKQRKKEQNKTAAQKYRERKRGEKGMVMTESEQLERRNIELRTRVDEMTREIDYLKGLIEEICA